MREIDFMVHYNPVEKKTIVRAVSIMAGAIAMEEYVGDNVPIADMYSSVMDEIKKAPM